MIKIHCKNSFVYQNIVQVYYQSIIKLVLRQNIKE